MSNNSESLVHKLRLQMERIEFKNDFLEKVNTELKAESEGYNDSIMFLALQLVQVRNGEKDAYNAILDWDRYRGRTGNPHIKEQSK